MVSIIVSKISRRKVIGASDKLLCLILKFLFFISSAKTAISIYWIHLNCREMCSFIFEKLSPSVFFIALILFLSLIGHFLMIHSAKIIFNKKLLWRLRLFLYVKLSQSLRLHILWKPQMKAVHQHNIFSNICNPQLFLIIVSLRHCQLFNNNNNNNFQLLWHQARLNLASLVLQAAFVMI